MAIKQLSDGGPDGVRLGQSAADLVGFWGATAAAQPAATAQSAIATTALTALTSGETLLGRDLDGQHRHHAARGEYRAQQPDPQRSGDARHPERIDVKWARRL
jgi:hypothetical protein